MPGIFAVAHCRTECWNASHHMPADDGQEEIGDASRLFIPYRSPSCMTTMHTYGISAVRRSCCWWQTRRPRRHGAVHWPVSEAGDLCLRSSRMTRAGHAGYAAELGQPRLSAASGPLHLQRGRMHCTTAVAAAAHPAAAAASYRQTTAPPQRWNWTFMAVW